MTVPLDSRSTTSVTSTCNSTAPGCSPLIKTGSKTDGHSHIHHPSLSLGANSFHLVWIPFQKGLGVRENEGNHKTYLPCQNGGKMYRLIENSDEHQLCCRFALHTQ